MVREVDAIHRRSTEARDEVKSLVRSLAEYRDVLITEAVTGVLDISAMSEARMDESLAAVREGETPEVLAK